MTIILILIAAVTIFGLGYEYGKTVEQKIVAALLSTYRKADAVTVGFVNNLLGQLDRSYSRAYDKAVAEAEKIEKEVI